MPLVIMPGHRYKPGLSWANGGLWPHEPGRASACVISPLCYRTHVDLMEGRGLAAKRNWHLFPVFLGLERKALSVGTVD